MVNGRSHDVTIADAEEVADNHMATGIDVVELKENDRVHIEFVTFANKGTLSNHAFGTCTFSGWKLN